MGEKEALLIIDMLNDFVREGAPLEVPSTREIIPVIKEEIEKARSAGNPILYICDAHDPDDPEFKIWPPHAVKGTEGAKVIDELAPQSRDIIVEKTTYNGFYKTDLEEILRDIGVTTVRLTGCVTHICVLYTAAGARVRGFDVKVVERGVAPLSLEDHQCALRQMKEVLKVDIV